MPREWGRDPFFTFLPRERNDGLGDVHAGVLKGAYTFRSFPLKAELAGGYYKLPDVRNYALNKYGLPSYVQLNADLRYRFKGFLKGAEVQLLYVYKGRAGVVYSPASIINKVNLAHYSLFLQYTF